MWHDFPDSNDPICVVLRSSLNQNSGIDRDVHPNVSTEVWPCQEAFLFYVMSFSYYIILQDYVQQFWL